MSDYAFDINWARAQDHADPLRAFRNEFLIPPHAGGEQVYLCGNSLGLQPRATRQALLDELDDWARLGVEGHVHGRQDRKSTRLNSSHPSISYAVFCLKKKNEHQILPDRYEIG